MNIKVKLSGEFEKYRTVTENEVDSFYFEHPVTVKTVLKKIMIPDELSPLILINGMVKNKDQMLQDRDTLSIFPRLSGG